MRQKEDLIHSLAREIALQKDYLGGEVVETIYFGGGTPSLLTIAELQLLLHTIWSNFSVVPAAEITLEANPDDISIEKLTEWKEAGINRLSIGVQSFFDEDLQWMNRAHNAQQAKDNLQLAIEQFENITIDLIYGTPQLPNEKWKINVDTAIALNIPHFSCYALTVESKTPLDKMIREKRSPDVDPDKQSVQFLLLMQWMEKAGYEHYEISNFAKPGFRSKHNASYWQGKKYLGLGPSAHSFNGAERQWNISNNNQYITAINKGELPAEKEILTPVQQLNEYIMTSLRTIEGTNLDLVKKRFAVKEDELLSKAKQYLESGLMRREENALVLTKEGRLLADGIAARLFF